MASSFAGLAELNGTKLYYELRGDGPAIVLIHAGIAHHRMWDAQFEALAERFRVLRYDVRGYGRSPNPEGQYSDHEDLHALLGHLGIERAVLVGMSNGGRIALDYTLCHPERVQALVLAGSAVGGAPTSAEVQAQWEAISALADQGRTEEAIEATLRMWVDGPGRTPEQVDPAVREAARSMLRDLYAIPKELDKGQMQPLEPPALGRLHEIRVPAMVLVGDADVSDIIQRSELLAQGIPGARKAVLPGVAHLPGMESPAEFNRLLFEFLAEAAIEA